MPRPELPLALIEHIRKAVPDLKGIWLFGSTASGQTRPDSDLDIAFLASSPLDARRRWDLEQGLAITARKDVDLVELASASTVLRSQIVVKGVLVWTSDEKACALFAVETMSAYANLNEERAGILEDILQRGRIHGG